MIGLTNWCAIPNPKNAALYKWPRLNEAKMKTITHLKTPSIVKTIEDALPSEIGHYSLSDCFELASSILSNNYIRLNSSRGLKETPLKME